ncbi:MAG TPA: hypothetical protein VG734_05505 [Lacunisphaera sp.]|nr:hypothetical protein [Lacunisphaera sp.]
MNTGDIIGCAAIAVAVVWLFFGDYFGQLSQRFRDARATKAFIRQGVSRQAVVVHLRGSNLPPDAYEKYDVSTLEEQLQIAIQSKRLGEYDGNEFGPEETVLYMYGPDAEKLFAGVEAVLRAYPLCKEGVAVIRCGPPGSPQREVSLA